VSTAPPEVDAAYLEFRTAQTLYNKGIAALDAHERAEVARVARRQREIESRVLGAAEARGVVVPAATLEAVLDDMRGRYDRIEDYLADLAAHGLTEDMVMDALRRELAVEAVLERISGRVEPVSDTDAELFYRLHYERFRRPERRRASQILVTINEQFPDNRRGAALARIRAVAQRLARDPRQFGAQALKHSECPSAVQGGLLGEYRRGQLFAALDEALFALDAGAIGDVVESPLGFHLLRCDAILPAATVAFAEAAPRIREMLLGNRKRDAQQAWLRGLLGRQGAPLKVSGTRG
jgi:peptidyl-prolyl cis-trans isomerase C